jgi:ATP-dependent DNA ligase
MLATLTDERFSDPGWVFERKLDGERCLAFRDGEAVRLLWRTRQRLDRTYPRGRRRAGRPGARLRSTLR